MGATEGLTYCTGHRRAPGVNATEELTYFTGHRGAPDVNATEGLTYLSSERAALLVWVPPKELPISAATGQSTWCDFHRRTYLFRG